jgi:hypothetical protein
VAMITVSAVNNDSSMVTCADARETFFSPPWQCRRRTPCLKRGGLFFQVFSIICGPFLTPSAQPGKFSMSSS